MLTELGPTPASGFRLASGRQACLEFCLWRRCWQGCEALPEPLARTRMSSPPSVAEHQANHSRYLLEFEKPIIKMEQEIQRLESSQVESGRDYADIIQSIRAMGR